jgi:hypothetical protein
MKNLTQTQKDILANLTNEFESLNKPSQDLSNVLDIGGLLSALKNDKKRREEIVASKPVRIACLHETADKYVAQLNNLFAGSNVYIWVRKTAYDASIYFGTEYEYNTKPHYVFSVSINPNIQDVYFDSQIENIREYLEGCYIGIHSNQEAKITTIEEMLQNKIFISTITKLIATANK